MLDKIKKFAERIEVQQIERLKKLDLGCIVNIDNAKVTIKSGKKYYKVDVGNSGKFMVDAQENIFGIKAYGVINLKKNYGTLDTIDNYYWGDYSPKKLKRI